MPLIRELEALANPAKAMVLAGFFKTGPGQYGEGDAFWGITVPQTRAAIKSHRGMGLQEIEKLLRHRIHEVRLAGWLLLVELFQKADDAGRREAFDFYLEHADRANNWDLVDLSAPQVVGAYLLESGDAGILRSMIRADSIWRRRIAVVATHAFIRAGQFAPTLDLCAAALDDPHDLMHKACGWMLREMGKRGGLAELRAFLRAHHRQMPRTMLRYAIERMAPDERARWMA